MKPLNLYAITRMVLGVAALAAPAVAGRTLAGAGGAEPDAQAFLRGMGGREVGLGLGLLATIQEGGSVRPWLIAGVLADCGDMAGLAGAWRHMPPAKRWPGLGAAGLGAALGTALLLSVNGR
jgi:hypothetical protein